jgi:hypothetical protein
MTMLAFGGTAALRGLLGWNSGLDTCSVVYEVASKIGGLDVSVETGAPSGAVQRYCSIAFLGAFRA